MAFERLRVLAFYAEARRTCARLRRREDVVGLQTLLWRRMAPVVAATPALSHLAGRPLHAFPVTPAEQVREAFARWNTRGLSAPAAEAAADAAEHGARGELHSGLVAGWSTGSSGLRGLFVTSPEERARYLGQALARLLPGHALLRPWRIALCLRADNALYRDVSAAGRITFRFIPLHLPTPEKAATLEAFAPDVLIAPSHVLAELARAAEAGGFGVPGLGALFYGAEPMGAAERAWIAGVFGLRPDPIYQATEGFLGVPCREGVLHLNEDSLVFELEAVPGSSRFRPVVTDLRRTTQPVIRLRLDDLVQPIGCDCRCGSPLLAIEPVEGRVGDLWRWDGVVIHPREVERVIESALGPRAWWCAEASEGEVRLHAACEEDREAGTPALRRLLAERGLDLPVVGAALPVPTGPKRRRVTATSRRGQEA